MKMHMILSVFTYTFNYVLVISTHHEKKYHNLSYVTRRKFPENFKFGVSTAAYKIEGAWNTSDKTESIWDRMSHTPGKIIDNTTGDVACDSYRYYKRDVQMVKEMNLDFYKFSISWNRLLPEGRKTKISLYGLCYYNRLISEIIKQGITPHVSLYHFDLPQIFQDIGGWENPIIADYFEEFAQVAFDKFGDRVKHWITFNEPARFCYMGYGTGADAPGIKDTGRAEYKCGHNVLRAHAKAYRLYKRKAEREPEKYNGRITIVLNGDWNQPETNSTEDIDAADTCMQFETGWFAHPIFVGNYPPKMIDKIDCVRLPDFTDEELNAIKGSADYLGINHYTSYIIKVDKNNYPKPSFEDDIGAFKKYQSDKWPQGSPSWPSVVPWGFKNYLEWLGNQYDCPEIVIYENGYYGNHMVEDPSRLHYIRLYLNAVLDAIDNGVNVTGYGVRSLMDDFEWGKGFTEMMGLYRVDFTKPNLPRTQRNSGNVYAKIAKERFISKIELPVVSPVQGANIILYDGVMSYYEYK